ncbi:transposase [bacterium]|nr:transposase [bacterium]
MPRSARMVEPGIPYHITHRGYKKKEIFIDQKDVMFYKKLIERHFISAKTELLAYCIMNNHVHLIVVPGYQWSLAKSVGFVHRDYAVYWNQRYVDQAPVWQGRYYSEPLSEVHLLLAMRYVEQNPLRAGLVEFAEQWPWSSARVHLGIAPDPLVNTDFLGSLVDDWESALRENVPEGGWR